MILYFIKDAAVFWSFFLRNGFEGFYLFGEYPLLPQIFYFQVLNSLKATGFFYLIFSMTLYGVKFPCLPPFLTVSRRSEKDFGSL